MNKSNQGFTLIELIIAITVVGVLAAIALPSFRGWQQNAKYKEAARDVASVFMNTRTLAISANRQHRVEVNVGASPDQYRVTKGNRAFNSSTWSDVVTPWTSFSELVDLKANTDCDVATGTVTICFSPNGSSESQYICILDKDGNKKFRSGVSSSVTGRVVVQKRSGSSWN
jgi:prepilin-type N-terminal cleavage/methylation domain-containing protein